MCTVLLRLLPDAAWPVQVAFVRDEDRRRPSDPPGRWWDAQPAVIGGRDARAGGTWLAIDESAPPAIALLTDRFDPTEHQPDHVIASRDASRPGELARRARLLEQLGTVAADAFDTASAAPAGWTSLLDARDVQPDQLDRAAVHSVSQRPGFGTVGASLVAIARDGQVRYLINRTTTLDPDAWTTVGR